MEMYPLEESTGCLRTTASRCARFLVWIHIRFPYLFFYFDAVGGVNFVTTGRHESLNYYYANAERCHALGVFFVVLFDHAYIRILLCLLCEHNHAVHHRPTDCQYCPVSM